MGPDTSHTAIEAIGGLNLPGGGGVAPPLKKTLREVKLLSYVNKVSRVIRTKIRNPTDFFKETKGPLSKTDRISFEPLKTDSILERGTSFSSVNALPTGHFVF